MSRDGAWLQQLLDDTWDNHFADVPQENDVRIVFGRRAPRRLGSIGLDPDSPTVSVITMNGLFKLEEVPEWVVQATLVHELTHYAHGFNSPLQQRQRYPHAGGVIRREYAERGLLDLYLRQRAWLKEYWSDIVQRELKPRGRKVTGTSQVVRVPKPFWFLGDQ